MPGTARKGLPGRPRAPRRTRALPAYPNATRSRSQDSGVSSLLTEVGQLSALRKQEAYATQNVAAAAVPAEHAACSVLRRNQEDAPQIQNDRRLALSCSSSAVVLNPWGELSHEEVLAFGGWVDCRHSAPAGSSIGLLATSLLIGCVCGGLPGCWSSMT